MKPTSVISLVVAVLLIIAGFVTCLVAENMAEAEGQMLFAETRADGLVTTLDLSDTAISKLELTVSDAQINIYGQSESSYMELVNFRENYYSFSDSNRVVSFDEIPDMVSMLKFWENGVSFKGIRYLLDFQKEEEEEAIGDKVINIYLGGENIDLKILSVTGTECDLYIEKLPYNTDYTLSLEGGSLTMKECRQGSRLTLNGTVIAADLTECTFQACDIRCNDLTFNGYRIMTTETTIDCETVQFTMTPTQSLASINYNITLDSGTISIAGSNVGTSYVQGASTSNKFEMLASSGEVILNNPPTQAELTGGAAAN